MILGFHDYLFIVKDSVHTTLYLELGFGICDDNFLGCHNITVCNVLYKLLLKKIKAKMEKKKTYDGGGGLNTLYPKVTQALGLFKHV